MPYYDRAIDVYSDCPRSAFYEQCHDCDDELAADSPAYCDPDADVQGDPPSYVDRTLWLCAPCATRRGYKR